MLLRDFVYIQKMSFKYLKRRLDIWRYLIHNQTAQLKKIIRQKDIDE